MMQLAKQIKELKVTINYHAYGNMLIIPFNFDDTNTLLQQKFPDAAKWYDYLE